MKPWRRALGAIVLLLAGCRCSAQVCNLKVVTDASPDYSDMRSLIHSITDPWPTVREKVWALFYWNHIARRQTAPMVLHGLELTDPIRQFNDYGYTMCSTVAGISCAIWNNMGLPVRFWDISPHTVAEVRYEGRWHMVDNSMSALYTLCDGRTLAGVEDIGQDGACAASGGKTERGHIARYHCLHATGPNGFLTGADTQRSLDEEARCFNPNGLKFRPYCNNWDWGHRYILNLKEGESYTRHYRRLGDSAAFYVPNGGKDPDEANPRYRIRGNGIWRFRPSLSPDVYRRTLHAAVNIGARTPYGLLPRHAGAPAEAVFRVQGANVICSQTIRATLFRRSAADRASISVSRNNGLTWSEVWRAGGTGTLAAAVRLLDQVNGAYEVLVKVSVLARTSPADVGLRSLEVETVTMLNAKTQPRLNLGRNTVYVGAGEQTESIAFWPELQGGRYREYAVSERNVASVPTHIGYQGAVYPARAGEDAALVYRMDAPSDITRVMFGGRFYNRAPGSHIDLLLSVDGARSWTRAWRLSSTAQPWDVIHYASVALPRGHRSVWLKYLMSTTDPSPGGCSIYAMRMEARYVPAGAGFRPFQVTFDWSERQPDRSLVERSHTQTIARLPLRYTINVGGADHPVVNWVRISAGRAPAVREGYADGRDAGGGRYSGVWTTLGRNLAAGRPYTCSAPSETLWDAGDPDGKKLTDGVVGPPCSGGISMSYGAIWKENANPVITVDLGTPSSCASFGMNVNGYPWWDALRGEVRDRVEVLTSVDGQEYTAQGFLRTDLRWKDLPVNHMWPDDETISGATFRYVPARPVMARYVRYRVVSPRFFDCTELEVLDALRSEPFSMRIALPDEWSRIDPAPPAREERDPRNEPSSAGPAGAPRKATARSARQTAPQVSERGARPLGSPTLEPPTLHSLGVWWVIGGDSNRNARVELAVRRSGRVAWQRALPLFRVERGANRPEHGESRVPVPPDAWLFAGSALLLQPDTAYELRVRLTDPDGGTVERTLRTRTLGEPTARRDAPTFEVVPGSGGGAGTSADPFRGLAAARSRARPGDILLLHAGVYAGTFAMGRSGEVGRPIIWRGAGDGDAVIDGQGQERAVDASGLHDVWLEDVAVRNAEWGFVAHDAARLVVRRCRFTGVRNGITATRNDGHLYGLFICDNVLEGPFPWPSAQKGAAVEEWRGIQVSGTGHEICYNRVRRFKDGIDTFGSRECSAIDIHHNEVSECLDDGCELDYSERNNRLFLNRFTNVFQGISVQPVFGGPVYAFRNAVYNIDVEPIKMHNSPSGALFFHNTFVKAGPPFVLMTPQPVRNCILRNNLFIGSSGRYGFECDPPMVDCDFDYDGFAGGPWDVFMKWNGVRYATAADVRARAPVYRHAVQVDAATVFARGALVPERWDSRNDPQDLRLRPGSAAIDAGEVLPGVTDGFAGRAPDLGAYEVGTPLPHYGPRPRR